MVKTTHQNRVQKKLAISMDNWRFLLEEINTSDESMSDLINRILDMFREMKGSE